MTRFRRSASAHPKQASVRCEIQIGHDRRPLTGSVRPRLRFTCAYFYTTPATFFAFLEVRDGDRMVAAMYGHDHICRTWGRVRLYRREHATVGRG